MTLHELDLPLETLLELGLLLVGSLVSSSGWEPVICVVVVRVAASGSGEEEVREEVSFDAISFRVKK